LDTINDNYRLFDDDAEEINRLTTRTTEAIDLGIRIDGRNGFGKVVNTDIESGSGDKNLWDSRAYLRSEINRVNKKIDELSSEINSLNARIDCEEEKEKAARNV